MRKLKLVDMFSGAGGLSEGFRQAGYEVIAGSDIDPDACATYALNFPGAEAIHGDLRAPSVHTRAVELARNADVIVGGPPCQAFSQVRNHARIIDDPRNSLYREFVQVIAASRPLAFVMENVPGMDQMGVRDQVAEDLSIDGTYKVQSQVVDAVDFGVPQTRKRILFVGIRGDLGLDPPRLRGQGAEYSIRLVRKERTEGTEYLVDGPVVTLDGSPPLRRLLDPDDHQLVTVEQALSDLVSLKVGRRKDSIAYRELGEPSSSYQRMMRAGNGAHITNVQVPRMNNDTAIRLGAIPEGGNYRDLPHEYGARYLTGERWGPSNGSGRLGRKHYYAYRKLHRSMWAWTLNTKADSAYHYEQARALSVREFARLQSFPDRFVFTTDARTGDVPGRISGGAAHSKYRQVGNAVPPLLARAVADALQGRLAELAEHQQIAATA